MEYDPLDFDKLFCSDDGELSIDKMLSGVASALERMAKAMEEATEDSLSSPIGNYYIHTSPDPISGGYGTWLGLERKSDKKRVGPYKIQSYATKAESEEGHNEWRKMIIETPPLIIKDIEHEKVINLSTIEERFPH